MLSKEQKERYRRQITVVGEDGQEKIGSTRLLTAWKCGISLIHSAVEGFWGQFCSILPKKSPCLRCIVPNPPPVRETPLIGVTTGMIGCIQVTVAIILVTGADILVSDCLWLHDSIRQKSDRLMIERIPSCNVCCKDKYQIRAGERMS